jgi:hypothetical protein
LAIFYAVALPAQASLITWKLVDVKIAPGGWDRVTSASGWFTYDASRMTVVDWDIISPGHFIPCCTHFDIQWRSAHAGCGASCNQSFVDVVSDAAPGGGSIAFYFSSLLEPQNSLLLTTARALTDVAGSVTVLPNYSTFHCCTESLSWPVIAGVLVAVPEPSARLVLAFGLVALLGLLRSSCLDPRASAETQKIRMSTRRYLLAHFPQGRRSERHQQNKAD